MATEPTRSIPHPDTPQNSRRPGGTAINDLVLAFLARASAALILLMFAALVAVLFFAAIPSFREFGLHFLVSSDWRPNPLQGDPVRINGKVQHDEDGSIIRQVIPPAFGALPVIYGTAVSSAIALVFAIPLSFGAAIFLIRIAPGSLASPVSFLIEFLAAIPSIAYGLWGIFVLCPFLQAHFEPALADTLGHSTLFSWLFYERSARGKIIPIPLTGHDMFAGGLVLGIMILPIITSISRDVLRSVPRAQIEATVALGATWWESCVEMLKYSRSGLFGAVMLGLARAAGETMAVAMVIGNNAQIKHTLFTAAQSMASLLANEYGDAQDEHRAALLEVALILLVMSLLFNIVARWLVVGRQSRAAAAH